MSERPSKQKEEKAVATLLSNLKKPKTTNWLEIAEAVRTLKQHPEWGLRRMTEFFGVSEYLLRQIDHINDLTDPVKELVKEGKLGLEESYMLWRRGETNQAQAAKLARNLTAHEVRLFTQLLMKNQDMTMKEALRVTEETRTEVVRILMLSLDSNHFKKLEQISKRHHHRNVHETARKILEDNLDER